MKSFTAHCKVVGGKLEWKNQTYLDVNLPKYEGLEGVLTVKKKWNKRSLNQNNYFWLCMTVLAEYTGHTPEELHVIVKGLYCPKKQVKVGKKAYSIPKGTSELTKGEFVELMMNVSVMASELGVVLPDPVDYQKVQFIENERP